VTNTQLLLWMLAAGAGTFLLRASFLVLVPSDRLPGWAQHGLKFIPPAVLAALGVTAFVPSAGLGGGIESFARPVAALVALLVGLRWHNVFLTLAAGMGTLWILSAL
jgi:branched-subunit amino acid transport protein